MRNISELINIELIHYTIYVANRILIYAETARGPRPTLEKKQTAGPGRISQGQNSFGQIYEEKF
jgi:hypothetical protein